MMKPQDFDAVYDEAMYARHEIIKNAGRLGYAPAEVSTYLRIGDYMNFYAMVARKAPKENQSKNIYYCTPYGRDACVDDVRKVLTETIREMAADKEAYKAQVRDLFSKLEEGDK